MNHISKLLALISLFIMGVGHNIYPLIAQASEPVTIGIPHSEEYPFAVMMKNSFEMALKIVNLEGGINGRPLKLAYANDQGKPKEGENAIRKLVKNSGAVMLVGAYQSTNAVHMAGMADKLDIPFLVCTAADDRITQRKWKNVYRLNPPASEYAKGLEDLFLKKVKPESIAILYENSPFGTHGALRMLYFCRNNYIEITATVPYHKERAKKEDIGSAYFQRILASIKEEPPDVVYMISYLDDAILLVKKLRQLKINALLCGGAGGFTHQKLIEKAGETADSLLAATLWSPQLGYPGSKEYYEQYFRKYSIPPDYHGVEAYSAILVAADALRKADSFSSESIRAALDKTEITTPFGPVRFESYDNFERQNRVPTAVLQVVHGKFETIWPEKLASSIFIPPPYWRALK